MAKNKKLFFEGQEINVLLNNDREYISLTDMLKAKDGDFFSFPTGFVIETR